MNEMTLTALCPSVEAAKGVFQALDGAGVNFKNVSVLARGIEVDKHLIVSSEINANQLGAPRSRSAELSLLARKLSEEKRFLLDGCWAVGPIFQEVPDRSGSQGVDALAKALLQAGLSMKEAAALESNLKNRGGVWIAASGEADHLKKVEEKLRTLGKVEVKRFSVSPSSG